MTVGRQKTGCARHGEVGDAVAVEIPHRHGIRMAPGADGAGGLEGAVAVAQQHAHIVAENFWTPV